MTGYSVKEVARLAGLSAAQVRSYTKAGFLSPARPGAAGAPSFTFQDLVLLRAAKDLMAARVPAARIRRSLKRLRQQLPRGRALSELRLTAEGHDIVVHDGGLAWAPESGQLVLDFTTAPLAQRAAPMARRQARAARAAAADLGAEQWFDLGLELEVSSVDEARDAYRRTLELDPLHLDARINLGRLLQESGRADEAVTHYRAVLDGHPAYATAWFNLGIALEDLGKSRDAIKAYTEAIAADRRLADAHYNLARLYVQEGKKAAALRCLSTWRLLTGSP